MTHVKEPSRIHTYLEEQVEGGGSREQLAFDPARGELSLVPIGKSIPDAIVVNSILEDGFFARPRSNPNAVQDLLEAQVDGEETDEQLAFDPTTGELRVVPARNTPKDAVVVDSIARDGFFQDNPRVYVDEEALRLLPVGEVISAIAYGFDDGTVYRVYLTGAPPRPVGQPVACAVMRLADGPVEDPLRQALDCMAAHRGSGPAIAVIAAANGPACDVRAVLFREGDPKLCESELLPPRSELYSRSRGLLETDALANKRVAVVGVGSGGSPIAVELAKAGVGTFVLIDPDRLELANVVRHVCGVSDIGRYKTRAVRDAILDKNPHATVVTHELDVNEHFDACAGILSDVDLLIAATDGVRSRFNLNQLALELNVTTLFGRALTRAAGGEVLRVRPGHGPCLACLSTKGMFRSNEEVSSRAQAARSAPAYTSPTDFDAQIQPGLSADIAPICNMLVKLALLELSRGTTADVESVGEDLEADFYIWANRRELSYAAWKPLGYGYADVGILRWYGARVPRRPDCPVCGEIIA